MVRFVDAPLGYCAYGGRESPQDEAGGDACDGAESDFVLSEQWIKSIRHDRNGNDNRKWVEVAKEIIWGSVRGHRSGLRGYDISNTAVVHIVDREEKKDLTSSKRTSDVFHKDITPRDWFSRERRDPFRRKYRRPGCVKVGAGSKSPKSFTFDGCANDAKELGKIAASRWLLGCLFVDCEEENWKQHINNTRKEVREPLTDIFFGVGGCKTKESANINKTIISQSETLGSNFGIQNIPLTGGQRFNDKTILSILVDNHRIEVRLE
jgi:hypothetical protein